MKMYLKVYENCKYDPMNDEKPKHVDYDDVIGFRVVGGREAEEIEADTDGSCIDEFHEYLVLEFADGATATYRNSHVDLFRW